MEGRALAQGVKAMIVFLVRAAIFPLAWVWAMGIAKRHEDTDPGARKKVAAAIMVGVIGVAGVGYILYDFQEDARVNMYGTMESRLAQVYGHNAFNDQTVNILAKSTQVTAIGDNLAIAEDNLDQALEDGNMTFYEEEMVKVVELSLALAQAERDLEAATTYEQRLRQEQAFFESIHRFIVDQDDGGLLAAAEQRASVSAPHPEFGPALLAAEAGEQSAASALADAENEVLRFDLLAQGGFPFDEAERTAAEDELEEARADMVAAAAAAEAALADALSVDAELPVPSDVYNGENLPRRTTHWLNVKTDAETDMTQVMVLLLFPGLIGVFYAPLMVALGSVMANAWEPSDSIGFKKYPGLSLGLFLLLGAFGWPSLLFSAWGFWDIDARSKEGQISL